MNRENSNLSLFLRRFFSGTLLSRLSGFFREVLMAASFGDHPSVAAFMIAFRFSQILRRILGEGALQNAFVPHFEELRLQNSERAFHFFRHLSFLLFVLLGILLLITEGLLTFFLSSSTLSSSLYDVLSLMRWMAPCLLFICLYGINTSLLQCQGSFFLSSFSPVLCNIAWIGGMLLLQNKEPSKAMPFLAKFVILGFLLQWLFTLPTTLKNVSGSFREWFFHSLRTISPEVRQMVKTSFLSLVAVSAVQVNSFFDTLFARWADPRGPVYLWYALRLEQLPFATLGIGCVSTLLPILSRKIKAQEKEVSQQLLSLGLYRIFFFLLPVSFAILALGSSSVDLIYGRGHFSSFAVQETTLCLLAYGASLLPSVTVMLFSSIFFAQKNFSLPMKASLFSVFLNGAINVFFVFGLGLGATSIALATTLSAVANAAFLKKALRKEGWRVDIATSSLLHILAASSFAFLFSLATNYFFSRSTLDLFLGHNAFYPQTLSLKLLYFGGETLAFILGFLLYATLFPSSMILKTFRDFFPKKQKA